MSLEALAKRFVFNFWIIATFALGFGAAIVGLGAAIACILSEP